MRALLSFAILLVLACGLVPSAPAQLTDEVKGQLDRARGLMMRRQYDDAIGEMKRAIKMANGQCVPCYLELVRAYQTVGGHKNAIEAAGKLLEVAPDDKTRATAHNALGVSIVFLADNKKANYADAEREFRAAVQLNPDNVIALYNLGTVLLKENRDQDGIAALKDFLDRAPNGPDSKEARAMIDNPRRARESFAPDFSFVTKEGEYFTLQDVKGKVVLLDFWASWCKPCQSALPTLQHLSKKYGKEQFVLISVSGDMNEQAWQSFISQHRMDWPQVLDRDRKINRLFKVSAIPTYVLIDSEGIMQSLVIGTNFDAELENEVKKNLKRAANMAKTGS